MAPAPTGVGPGLIAPELLAAVKRVHLRTHRLVNTALAGAYRSTFRGQGIEFEEVRPYVPGDDVRAIDWNVTARTGDPYVKTYREERELTVHLLVDSGLTMDFGTRRWTKREAAAQLAGLVSLVALRNQDRVGLTLFGRDQEVYLRASKGSHHVLRIIREVLAAEAPVSSADLRTAIESTERHLRRRAMVILVSDFVGTLDSEGEERARVIESLARLGRRHDLIAARVLDPIEEHLPGVGPLVVRGTDGVVVELDGRSAAVRKDWERAAADRGDLIRAGLSQARVDHLELRGNEDLAGPLISFFRRRELKGARR